MRVEALKAAVIASKGTVGLVRIEKRGELGGMGVGTGILAIYLFVYRSAAYWQVVSLWMSKMSLDVWILYRL